MPTQAITALVNSSVPVTVVPWPAQVVAEEVPSDPDLEAELVQLDPAALAGIDA